MLRKDKDRVHFLQQWLNEYHNFIVVPLCLYTMYNSCQSDLGLPYPSEHGGTFTDTGMHWGWWRSDACMLEVNKGYGVNLMVSSGFMLVEYLVLELNYETPSTLQKQIKFHHLTITSVFILSLVAGYGFPSAASGILLGETSNIFLNYKDMFTRETRNTPISQLNQAMFFISHTIFRECYFPYVVYKATRSAILTWSTVSFV